MNRRRVFGRLLAGAVVALFALRAMPQALAFPHYAEAGSLKVWSEAPLDLTRLDTQAAEAQRLVAASPLARPPEARRVFLTKGGWRWQMLALTSRGAFAISLPFGEAIVFNRTDPQAGFVRNGRAVGGVRRLSAVLAHEITHGVVRREIGQVESIMAPAWLREGYCDYVAQDSSLTAAEAARLKAEGTEHPALVYFDGRQRVAAELAANGGDVRALFAAH